MAYLFGFLMTMWASFLAPLAALACRVYVEILHAIPTTQALERICSEFAAGLGSWLKSRNVDAVLVHGSRPPVAGQATCVLRRQSGIACIASACVLVQVVH